MGPSLQKLRRLSPMNENPSFEDAFARLESILDRMNSGKSTLEESLKLYEEADQLIALCNTKLLEAEQKIETLIKNRDGNLATSENGKPLTQEFLATNPTPF